MTKYKQGDTLIVEEDGIATYVVKFDHMEGRSVVGNYVCLKGIHFENYQPRRMGLFLPKAKVIKL
jgi:hypothetical protein